jgi:hypothetical protein
VTVKKQGWCIFARVVVLKVASFESCNFIRW